VAVSLTVILGFAALAIDLGVLYVTRAELQRAADAGALAGASCYYTDAGLAQDITELIYMIDERARSSSVLNRTLREGTLLDDTDIVIGTYDHQYTWASLDTSGAAPFNAVNVTTRRTEGSANGSVVLFFARVFGISQSGVVADAIAVADDRFAGLRLGEGNTPITPFTLDVDVYDAMCTGGNDDFSYDGGVLPTGDGIREVDLYPWKLHPSNTKDELEDLYTLEDAGSGNFGILDFTGGGASATADRILSGVSSAELEAEVGTSELTFCDDSGSPLTYMMSGGPGVTVSVVHALEQRIGDVVGFFLHDTATATGTNTAYQIVGLRFGRIMEFNLTGKPEDRRLVVQPVAYTGSDVIINPSATPSGGQIGRVVLVQ
jgi:hypothetical protein